MHSRHALTAKELVIYWKNIFTRISAIYCSIAVDVQCDVCQPLEGAGLGCKRDILNKINDMTVSA